MPNNELQELLGARFDRHTHSTDESVWNAIEAQLDEEKSDRVGIWFWILNSIAATLIVGLMFKTYFSDETKVDTKSHLVAKNINDSINTAAEQSATKSHPEDSNSAEHEKDVVQYVIPVQNKEPHKNRLHAMDNPTSLEYKSPVRIANLNSLAERKTGRIRKQSSTLNQIDTTENRAVSNLPFLPLRPPASNLRLAAPFSKSLPNKNGYLKALPIHVGLEASYLNRLRPTNVSTNSLDTSLLGVFDQLATNRQFELNLFAQFDFTRRFSASIGFGHSKSAFSSKESWSTSGDNSGPIQISSNSSTYTVKKDAFLRVFSISIQAKYTFFSKGRFNFSGGLAFQREFGTIDYSLLLQESSFSSATSSVDFSSESSSANKYKIRQYAIEPFAQFSFQISPRFSSFVNVGYRNYFKTSQLGSLPSKLNFFQSDFGVLFKIR